MSGSSTARGRPEVAVLGIGTMGDAMARNIAAAGLGLRVWNRKRAAAEPLTEVGAVVCDTAAAACRGAKVVLTVLANERVVSEVMEQARDGLDRDAVWLQCCTVSPEGSLRLAEQADGLGAAFFEAPVLGTREPAVAGTLTILAAESLTLAGALGVDPHQLINVINGSALDSKHVQSKGPKMISDDLDTPSFPLESAAKDAVLITKTAHRAGLRLGIAEVVRDRLQSAATHGQGRADVAATYWLSRRAA